MSGIRVVNRIQVPQLRIGTPTNNARFDTDGQLILTGNARVTDHLNIGASELHPGAASPTGGFSGVFPHLSFSNTVNQDVHHQSVVGYKWDSTTGIEACLRWYYAGAQDNGTVKWDFTYLAIKAGEDPTAAGTLISVTTSGNHTTGQYIYTCIPTDILAANLERGDDMGIKIERDQANDTLATPAILLTVHLHFIKNNIGKAI